MSGRSSAEPTGPEPSNLTSDDPTEVGPYRVLRRLGAGGMGTVYLAADESGHQVAVKIVRSDLARLAEFRERFKQEADNARRVARFCTAAVLAVDVSADTPYLVTEYVDGPTLSEAVNGRGPLTPAELHQLAVSMTTALMAIHRAGIVHRDLKPSNILLSRLGPKVIDFGIARALDAASVLSQEGRIGTPAFMAPEQARGESVTSAADVFAWGGVLLYAGTGRYPFGTGNAAALLYRTVNENPATEGFEASLRPLVEAAMHKVPSNRPTAEQLYARLLDLRVDVPVAAADMPLSEVTMLIRPLYTSPGQAGSVPYTGPNPTTGPHPTTGPVPLTGPNQSTGPAAFTGPRPAAPAAPAEGGFDRAAGFSDLTQRPSDASWSGPGGSWSGTGGSWSGTGGSLSGTGASPGASRFGPSPSGPTPGHQYSDALTSVLDDTGSLRPSGTSAPPQGPPPRTGRRGQAVAAFVAVLAVIAAVVVALQLTRKPDTEQGPSVAETVAANAIRMQSSERDLARRLALAAYLTEPDSPVTRNAVVSLFNTDIKSTIINYTSPDGDSNALVSVAFSRDGRHIAAGAADGAIVLWDVSDRAQAQVTERRLTGHTGRVNSLSFNKDGSVLASGGSDRTVRLWDLSDPTDATEFSTAPPFHTEEVMSVMFSPDGNTLASGGADGRFALWAVTDPAGPFERSNEDARNGGVQSVAFSADGTLLALGGGDDGTVRLWDVHDAAVPSQVNSLAGHARASRSVAFAPKGSPGGAVLVSGGVDGTVRRWDVNQPSDPIELSTIDGEFGGINGVAYSPNGSIVAEAREDKTVRLTDVSDGASPVKVVDFQEHSLPVSAVTFSPDGKTVASTSHDGSLRLWDIDPVKLADVACDDSRNQISPDEWAKNFGTMEFAPGC